MFPNQEAQGLGRRCLAFAWTRTIPFLTADHTMRVRAGKCNGADLPPGATERLMISTVGLSAVGPGTVGASHASAGSSTSGMEGNSGAATSSFSKDTPFVLGLDCAREPESAGSSVSAADLFFPRSK